MDNSILCCPQCHIQLVKGDGCDSITCVCGKSLQWSALLRETNDARSFLSEFPDRPAEAYAQAMCVSTASARASAWGAQNSLEARNALLRWWGDRHGLFCATQATLLPFRLRGGEVQGPLLSAAATLWQQLHPEEVRRRQSERDAALGSLVRTYFPREEDLCSPLAEDSLLGRLGLEERALLLDRRRALAGPHTVEADRRAKWSKAEQFVALFGHLPVRLSEAGRAKEDGLPVFLETGEDTSSSLLSDLQAQFSVGMRVSCKWSQGFSYHDGMITAVRGDGKYDILYNDGDRDYNVSRVRLKRKAGIVVKLAPSNLAMSKEQRNSFYMLCKCLIDLRRLSETPSESSLVNDEAVVRLSSQYLLRHEGSMEHATQAARNLLPKLQFLCPTNTRLDYSLAWTHNSGVDFFGSLTWREVLEASLFLAHTNCCI